MVADQPLQLRDQLAVDAAGELGMHAVLDRAEPQLGQPLCLGPAEAGPCELLKGPAAPERERPAQRGCPTLHVAGDEPPAALAH
jgi:hypothetical protein